MIWFLFVFVALLLLLLVVVAMLYFCFSHLFVFFLLLLLFFLVTAILFLLYLFLLFCFVLFCLFFDTYLRSEIESAKSEIQFFLLLHAGAEDNNSLFRHLLDHPYKYHFSSLVYLSNLMSSNVDLCN